MGDGQLTASGFDPKRLEDVLTDLRAAMRGEFGQSLNLETDTPEGKFVSVMSAELTELWERLEAVHQGSYPGGANGTSLDRIGEITAINRRDATRSTGNAYLRGTGATVDAGSLISVTDVGDQFRTLAEAIIPASGAVALSAGSAISVSGITRSGSTATATSASHGLPNGAVVTIAGANQTDYNVTAEISNVATNTFDFEVSGTPTTPATGTITFTDVALGSDHLLLTNATARSTAVHGLTTGDFVFVYDADQAEYNGVFACTVLDTTHFQYTPLLSPTVALATGTVAGADATAVEVEAVDTGPVQGLAGTLTTIDSPVSGWDAVGNAIAMTTGLNEERDTEFRIRRLAALQGLGNATIDAITGDLLLVEGVISAIVFENDTDFTVGSRPPHSIECLADGGADADIAQTVWDSKAGGIATFGSESDTATDSQGNSQTINFTRPTNIDIYLDVTLTTDSDYPANGDELVETEILSFTDTLSIGDDVIVSPYLIGSFADVPGVVTVVIDIGIAPAPSGDANITIAETERALFTAVNTTVTS